MLDSIFVLALLVILFGATILAHEFGHYVAARLCGMVVQVFSIGFGPTLWKKKHKGIVYRVGLIPAGGYVALPQLDPAAMASVQGGGGAEKEGDAEAFAPAPPWKRIVVSLAGALGNILLAVAIAWIVYWVGRPAGPAERSTVVGYVAPESPAAGEGIRMGDKILAVNGVWIHNWSDFMTESALYEQVALRVDRPDGEEFTVSLPTEKSAMGYQVAGVEGRSLCMVLSVEPGKSAAKAGLRSGDQIVRLAGQEVFSRSHLIELVNAHAGEAVSIDVRRAVKGEKLDITLSVTPEMDPKEGRARIGFQFNMAAVEHDTVVRPLPSAQLKEHATAIFRFLKALTNPRQAKAASGAVGGPIAIVFSYWLILKTSVMLAIWFTGFLNVNLAIINLLPIPVLDGGHIVFALWEMVFRRPVHAKIVNFLVNMFASILIVLFVLLSLRDVDRLTPVGERVRRVFRSRTPAGETRAFSAATNSATELPEK